MSDTPKTDAIHACDRQAHIDLCMRLERENAALREALRRVAERMKDASQVMRERRADYFNPDYYERTGWRCLHVLAGGDFDDADYDDPVKPFPSEGLQNGK